MTVLPYIGFAALGLIAFYFLLGDLVRRAAYPELSMREGSRLLRRKLLFGFLFGAAAMTVGSGIEKQRSAAKPAADATPAAPAATPRDGASRPERHDPLAPSDDPDGASGTAARQWDPGGSSQDTRLRTTRRKRAEPLSDDAVAQRRRELIDLQRQRFEDQRLEETEKTRRRNERIRALEQMASEVDDPYLGEDLRRQAAEERMDARRDEAERWNRPAQQNAAGCCDGAGNRMCALSAPATPGSPCFCGMLRNLGYACQ